MTIALTIGSVISTTTGSPITSTVTLGTTIVLTGTSTSTISASANSSTGSGSGSSNSSNSDVSGLSEGARIGIGIGGGVFVIIGIGAATWIVYKRRSRRRTSTLQESGKDVVEVRSKALLTSMMFAALAIHFAGARAPGLGDGSSPCNSRDVGERAVRGTWLLMLKTPFLREMPLLLAIILGGKSILNLIQKNRFRGVYF